MYSRYSGVSIPQNYGGSRFAELSEVETKTHRATIQPMPIKASPPIAQYNDYEEIEEEVQEDMIDEVEPSFNEDAQETGDIPLKALLSSFERDELILLVLILLLISDSSQSNTEAVMMLVLLLIGGK